MIRGRANPTLGHREVMTAPLDADHHLARTGQVPLGDKRLLALTTVIRPNGMIDAPVKRSVIADDH